MKKLAAKGRGMGKAAAKRREFISGARDAPPGKSSATAAETGKGYFTYYLPKSLGQRVREAAVRQVGTHPANLVEAALTEYLDKLEKGQK